MAGRPQPPVRATVLYPFEAQDEGELTVRQGEQVLISNEPDSQAEESEGWVFVVVLGQRARRGFVPEAYLSTVEASRPSPSRSAVVHQEQAREPVAQRNSPEPREETHPRSRASPPADFAVSTPEPNVTETLAARSSGGGRSSSSRPRSAAYDKAIATVSASHGGPRRRLLASLHSIRMLSGSTSNSARIPALSATLDGDAFEDLRAKSEEHFRKLTDVRHETFAKLQDASEAMGARLEQHGKASKHLIGETRTLENMLEDFQKTLAESSAPSGRVKRSTIPPPTEDPAGLPQELEGA